MSVDVNILMMWKVTFRVLVSIHWTSAGLHGILSQKRVPSKLFCISVIHSVLEHSSPSNNKAIKMCN
jgi:hypothetical protein